MTALTMILAAGSGTSVAQQPPALSPIELVRRTVQNETKTASDSAKYMFLDRKETLQGSQTKLMVETRDAMAAIVVAYNDHPLNPQQRQEENARVERFLQNPDELRRKQDLEKQTADRITRIVKALPDAFLYEYDGNEASTPSVGKPGNNLLRLKFRPNPGYDPPTRVEQVLTGMQGYILIDALRQRIAKIDGTLAKDVGFGWGILGHLDRGGHFLVEQGDVNNGDWEITRMALTFTGRVLLFKSLNIKSTEVFSDFRPVDANLSFAQGVELLKKQEAILTANQQQR
jgi:murein DD-endopeptidase MepM/ murein hydrolase activator NlpD